MTIDKTARRVYSAEELHRLRSTFSQPKLRESIEKNDDRDAELVKGELPLNYLIQDRTSLHTRVYKFGALATHTPFLSPHIRHHHPLSFMKAFYTITDFA